MLAEVDRGERVSLYRARKQIEEAKDLKGGLSAASWFLGGQVKSTITCQATPKGILASKIKEAIGKSSDGQTRLVLEDGGAPVTLGLKVKDPFHNPVCQFGDPDCWVTDGKCGKMIEKQHSGTSMNDKLERGRGTGVIRIQASVT